MESKEKSESQKPLVHNINIDIQLMQMLCVSMPPQKARTVVKTVADTLIRSTKILPDLKIMISLGDSPEG